MWRKMLGICRDGGRHLPLAAWSCWYHTVPLQGSPLTARKIQGFVLKMTEKVETIKSTEPLSSTMAVSSSCLGSYSCFGGAVPTLGHSWGQVFTRSCLSLHKLPVCV